MSSAERSITDCNVHSEDDKKTAAQCECQLFHPNKPTHMFSLARAE